MSHPALLQRAANAILMRLLRAAQKAPPGSSQLIPAAVKTMSDLLDPATRHAAVAAAAFSNDPARWAEEARTYMMNSSPERTRAAEAAGDLGFAVATIAATGRKRMHLARESGVAEPQAMSTAKVAMLDQLNMPIEGPTRITARAAACPPLSYPEFKRLQTWLQFGTFNDEAQNTLVALMTAIVQVPELGRLLDHPVFASDRSDKGVLQDLLLGAREFGLGHVDAAMAHFKRAYGHRPEPVFAICVANCHRLQGDNAAAVVVLDEALVRWPSDAGISVLRAGLAFAQGEVEKANEYLAPWRDAYFARYDADQNMIFRRKELEEAMAEKRLYRKAESDIYDDSYAESTWWNYWFHFNAYTRYQHAEAILGELVPEHLNAFLRDRSPRPKTVVEVGTMCGELLYRVAVNYPDVHFVGVDRNPVIKRLNDEAYHLPNLEFRADDILNVLEDGRLDFAGAVLFHTRTSPFLFPDFMRQLYRRCHEKGFGAITMVEAYPVSITHKRFQRFEDMPQVSEIRGGGLLTHNYPKILREAGFSAVSHEIVRANTLFSGIDSSVFLTGTA